MKLLKFLIVVFTFSLVGISLSSCGVTGDANTENAKQGKEYTSAYICPMHCEGSGSEKAGTCPVCKMDYVANDATPKANDHGHNHDHDHGDGHSH